MSKRIGCTAIAAALLLTALASGANAAFKRIYVNPNGTDSATCGAINDQCKTLQGGIDRAGDHDEVFLQGPADFKPAVAGKSISIMGAGVFSTDSEPCLTINGGPDTVVAILDFECHQPNPSFDGIKFVGGRSLRVVNSNFHGARGGCGIRFEPTGQKGNFEASHTYVRGFGGGLCLESQGANQEVTAVTTDTRLLENRYGLVSEAFAPGHSVRSYNYRCELSGGGTGVYSNGGPDVTGGGPASAACRGVVRGLVSF
jgi:hypothetical protein